MHPAELLIERVEELLKAAIPEAKTEAHRTLSLSDEQTELPALIVTMGSDDPLANLTTFDQLGSGLNVTISIIDRDKDEKVLVRRLTKLRSKVHAALMPVGSMGFPWAIEVGSLGANAIVTDQAGTFIAKDLTTRWQIAYLMDRSNPDIPA